MSKCRYVVDKLRRFFSSWKLTRCHLVVYQSALARTVFEDTYLTVMDVDGIEWAEKLRVRMQERKDHNGSTAAAAPPPSSEQTPLMNV